MKRTGIILLIILLFIASGALAVLYQYTVSHIAALPPSAEEIAVEPVPPAAEKILPGSVEIIFSLKPPAEGQPLSLAPASSARELCAVNMDGSLHFLFGDLCKLEVGQVYTWPALAFVWVSVMEEKVKEERVVINLTKEGELPSHIALLGGDGGEAVIFDEAGVSVQRYLLNPGSFFPLGLSLDLSSAPAPQEEICVKFIIGAQRGN